MTTFSERLVEVPANKLLDAFEASADQLGLGVFVVRVDLVPAQTVYVNAQVLATTGKTREELVGRPPWEILAGHQRDELRALIASRGPDAPPLQLEQIVERPDGRRVPVEIGLARVPTGGAVLTVGYMRDVTGQHAAMAALRESERRFRSVVEGAPDGVVIAHEGRVEFANAEAARMFGWSGPAEALGKALYPLLPTDEARHAQHRIGELLLTGQSPPPREYKVVIDGEPRNLEIKSMVVDYGGRPSILSFARDTTERRRLEEELVRSDRLAAVGTLAAAVAHEINNPLTYAHLSLQQLERELSRDAADPRSATLLEHVRNARHGAERVATIVRDLRAFARVDDAPPGPVDVTAVVERSIKIAEHDLRHRARLVRRFEQVPLVEGNASRLEQVFLNLLINAIQALPDGHPSRDQVEVEVRAGEPGEVIVAVSDTGAGIPAELRARIFDPFFTTKPVGEGTGLGLSVCRSIVEAQGGRIAVDDTTTAGTRILVTLREHHRDEAVPESPATSRDADLEPDGDVLRVLVIDDEPLVRRVLAMVLEPHHDVTCVESGSEALALLDAPGTDFDVILCDLMMPGLSGADLYELLVARHPGLQRRVVFITAGAFVPRLAGFLDTVDNPRLLKPFDVQQVLSTVRAVGARPPP